ncbi:bile acid:sodium symporter family protein [Natranaerofaba carboxydovora]|uniref:bile acid:sodium symporter family protein n=1 Tax=Natranaerofaba carboxydovora TaxID=2742683 RepID=UPI001F12F923|nr:bile acid:sodium symporter family protein [Natranaerofaba carboxydovora]UMZ73757.1 Pantothenate precursors transporter PanS [Natranaerofaba carboxydovora]
MKTLERISKVAGDYFAVWVIIVAVLAFWAPASFQGIPERIPLLLGIIMFGMGMTLKTEDFKRVLSQPKSIIVGVIAQYTIMSLVAFALATIMNLPPELAVGMVLVGTCPGGTASNVMAYLAKGNVPVSVSMTSISTILAPLLTPIITLALAGQWLPVAAGDMFIEIVQIVILPIVLGIIVRSLFSKIVEKAIKVLPLISVLAIVAIVGGVVSVNTEELVTSGVLIFLAVILHNIIGLFIGYSIGKFFDIDEASRRAISIEVGMQNSGLASSLAMAHFSPLAALPGAIFSVWHNISGPLLATYWARKSDRE